MPYLLQQITHPDNLQQAFQWLCARRKDYSPNSDVWDFRRHWDDQRASITEAIQTGRYQFDPVSLYAVEHQIRSVWSARDALVLRATAQVLSEGLSIHPSCLHSRGHGGVHKGLRWANQKRKTHRFLYRSDVKGYYRHIRHGVVLRQLRQQIHEPALLHLLRRYLHRVDTHGGHFCCRHQGLNKGDPLAPLIGALYLKPLDVALSKLGEYRRFMDDWVVFTDNKKRLRQAIRTTKRVLKKLGMIVHPDKTFAGPCERPFHFLGIQFEAEHLTIPWQRLLILKTKLAATPCNAEGMHRKRINSQRWYDSVSRALNEPIYFPDGLFNASA